MVIPGCWMTAQPTEEYVAKTVISLFKVPKLEDVPEAARVIKDSKGTVYVDESGKTFG